MEKLHEYDLSLKHHQNSEVTGIPLQNYDCLQKDQPIQDVRKWSAGPQPQPSINSKQFNNMNNQL